MARALWRPLKRETDPGRRAYRVYTSKFDRVVHGDQLDAFLGGRGRKWFEAYATELEQSSRKWRASAEVQAIEATAALKKIDLESTVACLLIDHSGSMRGQRAILATAMTEIVADLWSRLGIAFEILGFTTQSWHGGRSRRRWKWRGSPSNPGRLCDLLHIVYREADDHRPGAPWALRNLNRRELLKENVDGEAIEWATSRLLARPEKQKILIVISDGTPVDDSTLAANDAGYLHRHLVASLASAQAQNITLGAIAMGECPRGIYPRHVLIDTPQDMASSLLPFILQMLSPSTNERNGSA